MIEVTSKQHGDSIRFHIVLANVLNIEFSSEHNIYNFVVVKFKSNTKVDRNSRVTNPDISVKKHELAKDWSFDVGVTCTILNIKVIKNCSEDWSDWISGYNSLKPSFFDIDVKIYITKKYSIIQKKNHEDDTHTDFQLSADDGSVAVHKVYLASHSDVFKTMLDGQWKETAQGRVELKGVTQKTLQYFKDFMYLRILPDEDDELCPLLLLATRFMVEDLIRGCIMRIMQIITAENLDSLMEFAVENQIHELKDNILEKIPSEIFVSACAIKVNALMGKKETPSSSNE